MTEQQTINRVLEIANGQVGYREGANNYNKYAAELDPLKLTYGNKQNLAWCGEFVLWVFYKAFGEDGLKVLCSPKPSGIPLCSAGAQYFKDAGRWALKPVVGDVVFFYNNGGINHTGIVTGVSSLSFTTVEGNSSDMVSRRTYAITGDKSVAGFGIPKWSVVALSATSSEKPNNSEIPVEDTEEFSLSYHVLRKGAGMDDLSYLKPEVRAVQQLLIANGYTCGGYGADGEFWNGTEQSVLNFQYNNSLDSDGVVGPLTKAKLEGVSAK